MKLGTTNIYNKIGRIKTNQKLENILTYSNLCMCVIRFKEVKYKQYIINNISICIHIVSLSICKYNKSSSLSIVVQFPLKRHFATFTFSANFQVNCYT